ncbi:MAG TPA: hypothetical protein VF008_14730, partial [Niastella sp.]
PREFDLNQASPPLLEKNLKKGIKSASQQLILDYIPIDYDIGKGIVLGDLPKTLIFISVSYYENRNP